MAISGSQPPSSTKTFRACRSSYVVFGIIIGGMLILISITTILSKPGFGAWWLIPILGLMLAFSYLWLSRFRLEITSEAVCFSSLFTGERTVRRSEMGREFRPWRAARGS